MTNFLGDLNVKRITTKIQYSNVNHHYGVDNCKARPQIDIVGFHSQIKCMISNQSNRIDKLTLKNGLKADDRMRQLNTIDNVKFLYDTEHFMSNISFEIF
ncbi:hypothetical protein BLOT_002736 [Blomia tropicalis]|nr:hypothetical protein BLOT_002736 [Blomia tropicalis]